VAARLSLQGKNYSQVFGNIVVQPNG